MNSLKEYCLKDCIELVIDNRGKTPAKLGADWTENGIRVISALNVHNGEIDNEEQIRCVSEEVYKKWMSEDIKREDCFIASEGASLGENCIWDSDEKIVLGQRLYALRTNKNILDPWYFSAYMQTKKFRMQIDQVSTGSTVFGISQTVLLNLKLLLPDIETQRCIGKLYKSLKRKISNNKKIMKELEEFARTIYDYWFLQYEFPNEQGKPYKSNGGKTIYNEQLKKEIPEGWEFSTIGKNIVERPKSSIQVGQAKDKTGEYPFFTSGSDIYETNEFLTEGRNCFLSTGGKGYVQYYIGKSSYSTDTWVISGINNLEDYIYLFIKSIENVLDKKYFAGTGLQHLQKDLFKDTQIVIPSYEVLNKFNDISNNIFNKTSRVYNENQKLIKLKDYLLPLLMNGQVSFKN